MKTKTIVGESEQITLAIQLIKLGARLQLLESQTTLSREKLIKLYKELKGVSPPKGMLPFSTDWFLTWQPNIHASIFLNIYNFMLKHAGISGIQAVMKAYELYQQQVALDEGHEPVLSFTRAWTLVRFVDSHMLKLTPCRCCSGQFVVDSYDLNSDFVCGICHIPSRAGKTKLAREQHNADMHGVEAAGHIAA
ncbi:flagellar transcriptional regulator FlhC [Pseudomethylobacillus aquaticus]|uniref:Flagellar transcriptional regulator FlhC n=1 Tax=Pseudomethylobacillus aquaticus TaxID=2676064 RepID=A0A3N0UZZ7_9PROT|nr:flagellar transcriptional regulator FlhC [Pseudomethylobacillus aquaticus]ROH86100.1 flagellar transcriptional regulator FlhC [Pseudomethylobacillus aquaticus]